MIWKIITLSFIYSIIKVTCNYPYDYDGFQRLFLENDANNNPKIMKMNKDINSLIENEFFNVKCFWINKWNMYDLTGLKIDSYDWNFTSTDSNVYFNFCENAHKRCDNTTQSLMIGYDSQKNCKKLAGDSEKWNHFSLMNNSDEYGGLNISLNSGEKCKDGNYTVTFLLKCDKNMTKGELILDNKEEFSLNKCDNILTGRTMNSCPALNYYIIAYFFDRYYFLFGAILIILGLFLVTLGVKFIKITVFLLLPIACATTLSIIIFNFFTFQSTTAVWIVLIVGLILGLFISWFIVNTLTVFFMILGGYMGYTISLVLYQILLHHIQAEPKIIFWITIIVCIVLGALFSLWLVKHVLIIGTCIIGGYAIIRGFSLYFGHFPDEDAILDLVQHKEWEQLDAAFEGYIYIYLAAWLVCTVCGLVIQYKINSDKNSDHYRRMK